MRATFAKRERIKKRSDFLKLFKYGRKIKNQYFIANYFKNNLSVSRLGITVSKKIGNAVERNRNKRIIREYYRLNKYKFSQNWDMNIVVIKKDISNSYLNFKLSLKEIFDLIERNALN
ncbi:MAG: ribonuclease P protein component [Desulfobacterales bacterium]|nr:ribonuclease P protein component [Desulfobacterales bacterium]